MTCCDVVIIVSLSSYSDYLHSYITLLIVLMIFF